MKTIQKSDKVKKNYMHVYESKITMIRNKEKVVE